MALIVVPQHSARDLEHWRRLESFDEQLAHSSQLKRKELRALEAIAEFIRRGDDGYLGVSWGKDSVCVAHLLWRAQRRLRLSLPVVWIVARPVVSPCSCSVRDEFLSRFEIDYFEILDDRRYDPLADDARWTGWCGDWRVGFERASALFGNRHLSGVRAAESGIRRATMRRNGTVSARTARPLGWWSGEDVFAYLKKYDLPVHPSYAMTFDGTLERNRIRVDALGGDSGTGFGRRVHEERYYRGALDAIVNRIRSASDCPWYDPRGATPKRHNRMVDE